MGQGRYETALLLTDAGARAEDTVKRLLDRMEEAGYDREAAARGLIKALNEPLREPSFLRTGP